MTQILTKSELADLLKMTPRQIDTLCETRTRKKQRPEHRLPILRVNSNVRFVLADVERWLQQLREEQAA